MAAEIHIIRHLAKKVPPGSRSWRPTPAQRSTIELLGYLTNGPLELTRMMVSGQWDVAALAPPPSVAYGAFDAAMEAQEEEIRRVLAPFDDRALAERPSLL